MIMRFLAQFTFMSSRKSSSFIDLPWPAADKLPKERMAGFS